MIKKKLSKKGGFFFMRLIFQNVQKELSFGNLEIKDGCLHKF